VALFQSLEFERVFPRDNALFPDLRLTGNIDNMRASMLGTERFSAAFFIGGMEGIEAEWGHVADSPMQRDIPMFPVASAGGASLILWERVGPERYGEDGWRRLRTDYNYLPLFRRLLQLPPLETY
jgi:hypothetical protein